MFPQVWFKNRRAKFRKGQRFAPLSKEECQVHCPATEQWKELVKDQEKGSNSKSQSSVRENNTIPSSTDSIHLHSHPRLHSSAVLPFITGEHYQQPMPHALGLLSAGLPFSTTYLPLIQQQHSTAVNLVPLGKCNNLMLQSACQSKSMVHHHLDM